MTRDNIIRMAQEAGFDPHDMSDDFTCNLKNIERLVKAAYDAGAKDEREACAHIVENWDSDLACPREVADAIRARGKK